MAYCPQRQVVSSKRRQATRVSATSPVSSSSSLLRQHLPQPSQSASHSFCVMRSSGVVSQKRGRRPLRSIGSSGGDRSCRRQYAGAGAIGVHLRDEGVDAVEGFLGAEIIHQPHRQVRAVEIAGESRRGRFRGWARRRRIAGARRARRRRDSVPSVRPVEHVHQHRVDAEARRVQPLMDMLAVGTPRCARAARRPPPGPRCGASGRAWRRRRAGGPRTARADRGGGDLPALALEKPARWSRQSPSRRRSPQHGGIARAPLAKAEIRADDDMGEPQPVGEDLAAAKARGLRPASAALNGQSRKSRSTPIFSSRLARASAPISRKGARRGRNSSRGCGSKVSTPRGAPISSPARRAISMTWRWPRCTPSKLPMAAEAPRSASVAKLWSRTIRMGHR